MKKHKIWMGWLGLAALIVLVSRVTRVPDTKEIAPVPMQMVEEPKKNTEETIEQDGVDFGEQTQESTQTIEDEVVEVPEITKVPEEDAEENNLSDSESQPMIVEIEESTVVENVSLPDVEPEAEPEPEADALMFLESQEEQEIQEIGAEEFDTIEDSLSAGDYAKGLSLLAQLPIETVDRFVELRKDGFTSEEQAEVKTILLASFEGEDLAWIVKTYKKLQP
jgi:hypothetical protein